MFVDYYKFHIHKHGRLSTVAHEYMDTYLRY